MSTYDAGAGRPAFPFFPLPTSSHGTFGFGHSLLPGGCIPQPAPYCEPKVDLPVPPWMKDHCEPFPPPPHCGPFPPPSHCEPFPPPPHCGPFPPPPHCPPDQQGKMWDVFFDAKTGTKTEQKSPIVLDTNGNGQADITGSNIHGNGKLEGKTVKGFDLDPSARQWQTKSLERRPGAGADKLPEGTQAQVFDACGNLMKTVDASTLQKVRKAGHDMGLGLGEGMRAEFRDPNGKLVGELKRDGTNDNKLLYFWGNKNENEWTKPWDSKTGGDSLLAWDVDGDGKITSGKELFGHVDVDGKNRFANGYEKLAHHFDKNYDGVVNGHELNGLKVWEDRNGDGVTQQGELVDARDRGITELKTDCFNPADMGSSFKYRPTGF